MINGQLYLAGRSTCLPANVQFQNNTLVVINAESAEQLYLLARDDIKVSPKLIGVPRELVLPDKSMLVLQDADLQDNIQLIQWLDGNSRQSNKVAKWETSTKAVLLSLLLVPLSIFSIFKFIVPAVAIGFADWIPQSVTDVASRHTLQALDSSFLDPSEISAEQHLEYIEYWNDVILRLELDPQHFNIQFRSSEQLGANAFALPNGTMVITDELIELVENDLNLLTAILLHEIGHVQNKHSMRLIAETLATSLLIDYFLGDVSGLIEFFGGFTSTVMQNQFSQKLEWEADHFALEQLEKLGMEKESFALAMESLAGKSSQESNLDKLLSSHPSILERISNARSNDQH